MKTLPEQFRVLMGMIVLMRPMYKTNTIRKNYCIKVQHYYTNIMFNAPRMGVSMLCA